MVRSLAVSPWRDGPRFERARGGSAAYDRALAQIAFMAPDLQRAILAGRPPIGMTMERLILKDLPLAWEDQRAVFIPRQG